MHILVAFPLFQQHKVWYFLLSSTTSYKFEILEDAKQQTKILRKTVCMLLLCKRIYLEGGQISKKKNLITTDGHIFKA